MPSDDFVFGMLGSDALRIQHVRGLRAGVTHASARAPRDPLPGQPVTLELTLGPAQPFDRAWVYWSVDGRDPQGRAGVAGHGFAAPLEPVGVQWDMMEWGYQRTFRGVLPGQPAGTVVRYTLAAGDSSGQEVAADHGALDAYYVDDDPTPDWVYDAVVYQVFVDRFNPGDGKAWLNPPTPAGFYGGTLRGVTEKLDFITGLGANTLWLTPIFPSPSHHGYDATDFFEIEPRLGSKEDLLELLQVAHRRGMRVLLDFVANHWSDRHSTFQQAIRDPASPYVDWYTFTHYPDAYEAFFGVKELPQVNLRNPAARRHMLEAAAYWLEFGVDGYRLDYAVGPTHDFWADFRRVTRQVRPDCWTFGEVVEPSDSQVAFHGLLDGCLDFILLEAIRQTFAFQRWDFNRLADFLDRHEAYFPQDFSRPSFLDNHDMNRFLWVVQGDKILLKLAALCQFTLAGPPVIYYGTEAGLSQVRDTRQDGLGLPEESRLPMIWGADQDTSLLAFYTELAAVRNRRPSLRRGSRRTLFVDPQVLVYARSLAGESTATAINLADAARTIDLPGKTWRAVLGTDPGWQLEHTGDVTHLCLPPRCGLILEE
jgi:glycosidase